MDMFNQTLKLKRKNGDIFDSVEASVQKKIYINDIKLPIEKGDHFEYVLPSGLTQNLLVTKVNLYDVGSSLDHYEIEFEKD